MRDEPVWADDCAVDLSMRTLRHGPASEGCDGTCRPTPLQLRNEALVRLRTAIEAELTAADGVLGRYRASRCSADLSRFLAAKGAKLKAELMLSDIAVLERRA